MLACVPIAAACWKDLKWEWLQKYHSSFFTKPWTAWIFTFFMLGLCLRIVTSAYYVSERRFDHFGLGLDEEKIPVRATEFLVQKHLDGKILNHMNLGGWLDWKGPQKVFIDGRLEVMGEEFFMEFNASQNPGGLEALVAKYKPDILFFNPDSAPPWILKLKKQMNGGWSIWTSQPSYI